MSRVRKGNVSGVPEGDTFSVRPSRAGRLYLFASTLVEALVVLVSFAALTIAVLIPIAALTAVAFATWSSRRPCMTLTPSRMVVVNRFRTYRLGRGDAHLAQDDCMVGLGQMSALAIALPPGVGGLGRLRGRIPIEATAGLSGDTTNRVMDEVRRWGRPSR